MCSALLQEQQIQYIIIFDRIQRKTGKHFKRFPVFLLVQQLRQALHRAAMVAGHGLGGVYKLAAIEDDEGNIIPKIKVSENTAKITNPHFKRLYRLYDRESGKAIADELTLRDEVIDPTKPHVIFDPNATWKTKELTDFTVRELQVPIFQNGELVYELPELNDIKAYCRQQIHTLWDEVKRFENPHTYYVDLSQKLWDVKRGLLEAAKC